MEEEIKKRIEELNKELDSVWDSQPLKKAEIGRRLAFLNNLYNALYNNFY